MISYAVAAAAAAAAADGADDAGCWMLEAAEDVVRGSRRGRACLVDD